MKRTPENLDRLRHVRDLLKIVPDDRFDLNSWKCETTACAVGWACSVKWFTDRGLTLTRQPYEMWGEEAPRYFYSPAYEGYLDFVAVQKFFGLTWAEAEHLFLPTDSGAARYNNAAAVIRRIDRLLGKDAYLPQADIEPFVFHNTTPVKETETV